MSPIEFNYTHTHTVHHIEYLLSLEENVRRHHPKLWETVQHLYLSNSGYVRMRWGRRGVTLFLFYCSGQMLTSDFANDCIYQN